jgi:Gpi18-like mannosyltransferase
MSFRIFPDLKSYLEVFDDTHNLTLDDKKALDTFEYKENLISVSEAVTFSSKSPLLFFKKMKIVIPYSFVQKKYWNQGFLNFFNIPNIPNVLIGLPFILFTFYILLVNDLKCKNNTLILKNLKILLFLKTILACFFFHWNMYFRLISFNPFLYWSIAKMYLKGKHSAYFILYLKYYFAFSVSYAILFGAFYPPA